MKRIRKEEEVALWHESCQNGKVMHSLSCHVVAHVTRKLRTVHRMRDTHCHACALDKFVVTSRDTLDINFERFKIFATTWHALLHLTRIATHRHASPRTLPRLRPSVTRRIACHGVNPSSRQCEPCYIVAERYVVPQHDPSVCRTVCERHKCNILVYESVRYELVRYELTTVRCNWKPLVICTRWATKRANFTSTPSWIIRRHCGNGLEAERYARFNSINEGDKAGPQVPPRCTKRNSNGQCTNHRIAV